MMKNIFITLLLVISLGVSASTDNISALRTPPSAIASLSEQKLNEFGLAIASQVYDILSKVGSPTDQLGGALNQTEKRAVNNTKALLDDKAMIQRSTLNHGITKETYIPTDVDKFQIDGLSMTRTAPDVLVATYYISLPNRVDIKTGAVMSGKSMPRITVLRWNVKQKQWLIFSHADFDTPQAMLCGMESSGLAPKKVQFSEADIALGKQLIDELVQSKLQGEKPNVYGKGYQIILASGERNSPSKPIASLNAKVEPTNLEAIRSDRLIAIRYDMPNALNVGGDALAQKFSPRLLTYQLSQDKHWELIASAVYGVTAKVAEGIKCIPPTAN
jgi:hypothetical protein